jgi:Fuc2NAc and GlcNAc transferase
VTLPATAVLVVLVAAGSWAGVALVRRYALRRLIDVPNDRSSHSRPTPRGGGLALSAAHLAGLVVAGALGMAPPGLVAALAGGGLGVATIGFLDDHRHVSPLLRLACHFLAFGWAIAWLGGLPPVDFGFGPVDLARAGTVLTLLYFAWFLNLFNFMDGIDGLAGMEALTMSSTAALLVGFGGAGPGDALPLLLLAVAAAGFLAWNWPPARIFMGDVGSGYLGFALGTLALWTVVEGWLTPWVWLILGGTFLADATVTLVVRARAKASLAEAHRSHAYQRLSRRWRGHRPVTLAFAAVNLVWLAPWAFAATRWPPYGATIALVALAPLFVAAVRLGAGRPDDARTPT